MLKEKFVAHGVTDVIILAEPAELSAPDVRSGNLIDFYGKEVLVSSYNDLLTTHLCMMKQDFEPSKANWGLIERALSKLICLLLGRGNILVHGKNGSGRTGFLVAAALKVLGVDNPLDFIRLTKTSYVKSPSQEKMLKFIPFTLTSQMCAQTGHKDFGLNVLVERLTDLKETIEAGKAPRSVKSFFKKEDGDILSADTQANITKCMQKPEAQRAFLNLRTAVEENSTMLKQNTPKFLMACLNGNTMKTLEYNPR